MYLLGIKQFVVCKLHNCGAKPTPNVKTFSLVFNQVNGQNVYYFAENALVKIRHVMVQISTHEWHFESASAHTRFD